MTILLLRKKKWKKNEQTFKMKIYILVFYNDENKTLKIHVNLTTANFDLIRLLNFGLDLFLQILPNHLFIEWPIILYI